MLVFEQTREQGAQRVNKPLDISIRHDVPPRVLLYTGKPKPDPETNNQLIFRPKVLLKCEEATQRVLELISKSPSNFPSPWFLVRGWSAPVGPPLARPQCSGVGRVAYLSLWRPARPARV